MHVDSVWDQLLNNQRYRYPWPHYRGRGRAERPESKVNVAEQALGGPTAGCNYESKASG